jgi:uncharacterized membrane protein
MKKATELADDLACEAGYVWEKRRIDRHLPVLFLVLGLPIGLLYAFIMPPLQVADEGSHFARLYWVSRGACVASPDVDIPQSFARLNERFPPRLQNQRKTSMAEIWSYSQVPPNGTVMEGNGRQRSFDGFINQNLYCCLPYVPAAVILNAGRHLGLSPLLLMYLARVGNLTVYLALTFFALCLLPDFQWVLFCVALMPMAMHQAASISADSVGFALSFLLCAYVFRLAFAKLPQPIGASQLMLLGTLIALVALSRSLPAVVLLPLLIPSASFGSARRRWLAIAAFTLLTVVCLGSWQYLNRANIERLSEERATREWVVDVHSNTQFLYQHPLEASSFFVRTITSFDYIRKKSTEVVGRLGWLSLSLPGWLVCLYVALLAMAGATQTIDTKLSWLRRGLLLAFIVAGAASILAAGWVLETPIVILGVPGSWAGFHILTQGRYWIPLAFPALILLSNTRIRLKRWAFAVVGVAVILTANGVAIHAIRSTYY